MEQGTKKTYTVKHPGRFAAILAVAVGLILLALSWALFLGRIRRRTADLSARSAPDGRCPRARP